MSYHFIALAPNLTARFVPGYHTVQDHWEFYGWREDFSYACDVPCDDLEKLTHHAKGGLELGRGEKPGTFETLVGIASNVTARIIYASLVETFIEIGGFYISNAFTFRIGLDMADALNEVVAIERKELGEGRLNLVEELSD